MEYLGHHYCTSYSKYFKYLWIFASGGADNTADNRAAAILKVLFKKSCFIPSAIKLLKAKSLNKLLYGAELNLYSNYNFMEKV